jgi:hypothetical protein
MWRTGQFAHHPARNAEHPLLRLLGAGLLLELLWAFGLLVMLAAVSVVLWAVLDRILTL